MKRIGILGGTFNPVHVGHLAIADVACDMLNLDKVIFVPSCQPPHKSAKSVISAKDRFNMVKIAIKNDKRFDLSDYEIKKGGRSYTIDTIEHFRQEYPKGTKLFFILGGDSVATLHKWKKISELKKIVSFVAIDRLGYKSRNEKIKVKHFTMLNVGISSSYVRKCIAEGRSVKYLLPDDVIIYIKRRKLFSGK